MKLELGTTGLPRESVVEVAEPEAALPALALARAGQQLSPGLATFSCDAAALR